MGNQSSYYTRDSMVVGDYEEALEFDSKGAKDRGSVAASSNFVNDAVNQLKQSRQTRSSVINSAPGMNMGVTRNQ